MKERKHYVDLDSLKNRVESDQAKLMELQDKKVLMLLGSTGAGKSTLANALIKGPGNIKLDDDGRLVQINDIEYSGDLCFRIGHKATSETKTPKYHPLEEDESVYLVDGPGINDANANNEYAN